MGSKNILVICPNKIFPIRMASQNRIYYMIKELSRNHNVDIAYFADRKSYSDLESHKKMKDICQQLFPIIPFKRNYYFHLAIFRLKKIFSKLLFIPGQLYYCSLPICKKRMNEIVINKKYDVIQFEYWYTCASIEDLPYPVFLALDTHNVNFEKKKKSLSAKKSWVLNERVNRYKELEMKYTGMNDLIISISEEDSIFFKNQFPDRKHITIPTGQDLDKYLNYPVKDNKGNIILFYGAMSSSSNIKALFRLVENILPEIRKTVPDVKLWVVGSNPKPEVRALDNGKSIRVYGFIEDIRETISQCKLFVLPLEIGGGFRTRLVEVMALGVPIVGTHIGIDSLKLSHNEQGFISDNDLELAQYAVKIIKEDHLRKIMAQACRIFVKEKFTIESTYSKLSDYYMSHFHQIN